MIYTQILFTSINKPDVSLSSLLYYFLSSLTRMRSGVCILLGFYGEWVERWLNTIEYTDVTVKVANSTTEFAHRLVSC